MTSAPWRTADLGDVATLQRGFDLPSRLRRPGSVPIVSSSGVSGWHNRAMVKAPGVVTGRYGTIGDVFFASQDFWPLNTTLWVSNFHGNDERFVYYVLQRVDFASHSGKSGVPGVNRNDVHKEVVNVPVAIVEQRAVASALTECDEMIASLERVIEKKRAIKQGLMQQLLYPRTRLSGFDEPWLDRPITDVALVRKGTQLGRAAMDPGQSFPVWNGGIEPSGFTSKPNVERDVVTVSEGGNSCGWVGRPKGPFWLGGHCYALEPKPAGHSVSFLFHRLKLAEQQIMALRVGSGLPNIQRRRLTAFVVSMPTDPAEASAIAKVLDEADQELALLEIRLTKARAIKAGMMQQLLTGRTRLPVEIAP
jgi:type I restriction enzyme, S subunit